MREQHPQQDDEVLPLETQGEKRDHQVHQEIISAGNPSTPEPQDDTPWSPSGLWYRDFWHFVGPGWFVAIAYVDPGNYQADIQAGATSRYSLLCVIWWTSVLSVYVQILCVRLAYYSNLTLAEAQSRHFASDKQWMRYVAWALAEFSTIITDLPEVIGIGIACHIFFGWPYYVGVVLSLLTTMLFLATIQFGIKVLESIIVAFIGVMSIALFVEMDFVGPSGSELMRGWLLGMKDLGSDDMFQIAGVVGAVVMPHNIYLHTAACQARPVAKKYVKQAVYWSSLEPIAPILVSFFVNMAIVTIAAEQVFGTEGAEAVGLSDFCDYFQALKAGCVLWGIALLAAGQSSAITTTYAGQTVMDGFVQFQLPIKIRAVLTRLLAITPCVIVSAAFPSHMNRLVNIVNASLSILLPFAFTPLVKYNCSPAFMGQSNAARGVERLILYGFAVVVWLVNAAALSVKGGGFFGDLRATVSSGWYVVIVLIEVCAQTFYAWWNLYVLWTPVQQCVLEADDCNDSHGHDGHHEMIPVTLLQEENEMI